MSTATNLTREHYQQPEVKEIICKHASLPDGNWRAMNGDFHRLYAYSGNGDARLLNVSEDYNYIVERHRTLYSTLNVFEPSLRTASRKIEEITPESPLGTPADTAAYTLGVDIAKGHVYSIEDPEIKAVVESAAQFFVDYLKERSISESVWPLFSGGGIYIMIHHEICRPEPLALEDRASFFEELTDGYNRLVEHVSQAFFEAHPEHKGKVKFDALNNSKKAFKCILSIHKSKPYAVTPLDRDDIKIDFERARLPLKEDMIAEARAWYSTFNPEERKALLKLLDQFKETEEEHSAQDNFKEIWRSSFKLDRKYFPPCVQYIIGTANTGEGKTRFSAVLSAYLYQMGWDEEEARVLVKAISDRNGLDNADHIFDSYYGRINCPSCKTIQEDGTGYPHMGLKGLVACQREEYCDRWPGDYSFGKQIKDLHPDRSILKDLSKKIKADPGIIYELPYFRVLKDIYHNDPQEWTRIKKILTANKVSIRDLVEEIKKREASGGLPIIKAPYAVLDDGRLAEMVAENGVARFAIYDPATQEITYAPEIVLNNIRIMPHSSDELFQKGYVTLPSEAEEYGSELSLYQEIKEFIHKYLEVSPDYESIAASYPMESWVYDVMRVIAYLRARGDWGAGKSRFLDVFRALCYRSISTTGAMSGASIFRIMETWKGTLIIDEGDFGKGQEAIAAMEKILVCGFERGKPVIRCNPHNAAELSVFDPFGPKVIATRYEFKDKALESRCFTEIMREGIREDVPILLPPEFEEEALHLRNKLLMYRFRNREIVRQASAKGQIEIDLSGLPKRIQQAARPLAVVLAPYPELLDTLKKFLEDKTKELVLQASDTTEGHIVQTMKGLPQLSNDGTTITWDYRFEDIKELIKSKFEYKNISTAFVRSRANGLGFKTNRETICGERKKRVICDVRLFDRLVARYIPQVDDADDPADHKGAGN